jgi:hypothetical protein
MFQHSIVFSFFIRYHDFVVDLPVELPADDEYVDDATDFAAHELLTGRARSTGALRAGLCRVASDLVAVRGWERLGFARAADYASERLGVSGRELHELAHVGERMRALPELEAALRWGRLSFSKVRLIARVADADTVERWISRAEQRPCDRLAKRVRRVDGRSSDDIEVATQGPSAVTLRCTAEARGRWSQLRRAASRVAGRDVTPGEALEMLTAEVLSAIDLEVEPEATGEPAAPPAPPRPMPRRRHEGLDPWELDERLRVLFRKEQQGEAEIGPLLRYVRRRRVYRALEYATLAAYVQDELGMSVRKAQMLLRIERVAPLCEEFERSYRSGELSWAKADVLAPILERDTLGRWHRAWVEHALGVTVRRLRDDVERACELLDTDPERWQQTGGLQDPPEDGAQTCAKPDDPEESQEIRVWVGAEVQALFWAAIHSVRRRVERSTGRLPTPGEAFALMLEHTSVAWGVDASVSRALRIFERDDWRCAVPGCSSRRNLQAHHIVFRALGGADADCNLITLCAFHHLRGVHGGSLRVTGEAPGHIRFALGIRGHARPVAVYESGDRLLRA